MAKKKKEEPIVDNETGSLKVKEKVEKQAAQGEAQAKASAAAAQGEIQKNEAVYETQRKLKELESQQKITLLSQETAMKLDLMAREFEYNMQLKQMEGVSTKERETEKEDRKDNRTKIQATQQSEMIEQRNNGKPPKNFESAGNDILGGGFDLGSFEPS